MSDQNTNPEILSGNTEENSPAHRRAIKSFVLRQGRLTEGQQRALDSLWPKYGLTVASGALNYPALFGNNNPVYLEIGFGMGKSLATMAENAPDKNFIGIEVHKPGVGALLNEVATRNLTNIRL
ncbi:MAG TPA: tRNA (guanosine(46)-N7)-methyltransferase TrmB, partial [Pseudomonadales bacterium]|nr:tRNA (guanosine(46)-N7)-methyltransferase TrmB [Pseudomonadales bacterium]